MIAQIDQDYRKFGLKPVVRRLFSYLFFEGRQLTTKGRFINPILKGFYRVLWGLPYEPNINSPVYILGMGRSGTTILGKLLSMHRDIGYLNEPKILWNFAIPNEDLLMNFTAQPAKYELTADDVSEIGARALRKLYTAYQYLTATRLVVDKYPELIFRDGAVRAIYPNAKYILLIRNCYDVCTSVDYWNKANGYSKNGKAVGWWGLDDIKWLYLRDQVALSDIDLAKHEELIVSLDDDINRAAVEWILTAKRIVELKERYKDECLLIRYEDLLAAPQICLEQVFDYVRLPHDENVFEYAGLTIASKAKKENSIEICAEFKPIIERLLEELGY